MIDRDQNVILEADEGDKEREGKKEKEKEKCILHFIFYFLQERIYNKWILTLFLEFLIFFLHAIIVGLSGVVKCCVYRYIIDVYICVYLRNNYIYIYVYIYICVKYQNFTKN